MERYTLLGGGGNIGAGGGDFGLSSIYVKRPCDLGAQWVLRIGLYITVFPRPFFQMNDCV